MDAFHHKDAVGIQFKHFAVEERLALDEVESGNLHLFAIEQALQMLVQQRDVERIDALEVVLAVRQLGSAVAADKIVVERKLLHIESQHAQLHAQAATAGGLARRGGVD